MLSINIVGWTNIWMGYLFAELTGINLTPWWFGSNTLIFDTSLMDNMSPLSKYYTWFILFSNKDVEVNNEVKK